MPTKKKISYTELPKPVRTESRICFWIEYYATDAEAELVSRYAAERGESYKGGFFHGTPVGRASNWDTPTEFAVARGYVL